MVVVVRWPADVLSHFGRVNSFGLMMILDISPSPDLLMMVVNSSWVILPNPLGIHNAGYSYAWGLRPPATLATPDIPLKSMSAVLVLIAIAVSCFSLVIVSVCISSSR